MHVIYWSTGDIYFNRLNVFRMWFSHSNRWMLGIKDPKCILAKNGYKHWRLILLWMVDKMGSIKYMDIYKFVCVFGFLFYNLTDLYRRTRFPVGRMVSTLFCKSSIRTSFRWIKCSMRLILACRIWNKTSKFMELSHINKAFNYIFG